MTKRYQDTLTNLISKLESIATEEWGRDSASDKITPSDDFTCIKKRVSKQIVEIRQMLKEREELLTESRGSGSRRTVELSSNIRKLLREAEESYSLMQKCLIKESELLSKGSSQSEKTISEEHVKVVELVGKHLFECQNLEKRRFHNGIAQNPSSYYPIHFQSLSTQNYETLQEIDPEVDQGLLEIQANDREIDTRLDELSRGVDRLRSIAITQKEEVKKQEVLIEDIQDGMQRSSSRLAVVNLKLSKTLKQGFNIFPSRLW